MSAASIHASADIDPDVTIGPGTRVWHLAHLRSGSTVGRECNIGRGAYIGPGVTVGNRCKVHNGAMLFEPARTLYASYGFVRCEPFADYRVDPYSVCMTQEL